MKALTPIVIAGNILFILWILFNGVDEGWRGTPMQIFSYVSLIALLALNSFLLLRRGE